MENNSQNFSALAWRMVNIVQIYRIVRPILLIAKKFFFLRPKWQNTLSDFIKILDELVLFHKAN